MSIHYIKFLSCDKTMVELQETLSFDDQILPLLLKEREKYNGKLTEESTGTVNTLSVNRISHVKMRR